MGQYDINTIGALDQGNEQDQAGHDLSHGEFMQGIMDDALSFALSPAGYVLGNAIKEDRQQDEATQRAVMDMGTQAGYGAAEEASIEANVGMPVPARGGGGGGGGGIVVAPSGGEPSIFDTLADIWSTPGPLGFSYGTILITAGVAGGGLYLANKRKKKRGGR